jgi:sensor c-di-GMP phosphodiesterase-like protein
VSINITPRELQNDRIVDLMNQMTEQSRIEPRQVSLEATERSLMDTNSANGIIRKLRKGGYSISIDDFGTGYSSLSYLQTLDVDNLKIDKCFIEAIDAEAATSGVVSHIIEMARTLKLVMIAEGVETEAQAEFLRDRGVQYAQGWLFSKALTRTNLWLLPRPTLAAPKIEKRTTEPSILIDSRKRARSDGCGAMYAREEKGSDTSP